MAKRHQRPATLFGSQNIRMIPLARGLFGKPALLAVNKGKTYPYRSVKRGGSPDARPDLYPTPRQVVAQG